MPISFADDTTLSGTNDKLDIFVEIVEVLHGWE